MTQLCSAEYEIRADIAAAFDAARQEGHVRSDLIHGVLAAAVRAWRNGAQLPPRARTRGRAATGADVVPWRFTCPTTERAALNKDLRSAGSSGRAVLEVFARAYVAAGGDLLAIELPWERAGELATAS